MILAIDVGGTKTLVSSWDHHGRMLRSKKIPTPPAYEAFTHALLTLIEHEFWQPGIEVISIAVPGRINYDKRQVARLGNLNWENEPIAALLEKKFDAPVLLENDANVAGLGEALALRKTPDNLIYVTFGTGIGSGIITDGHINPHLAHSEIGHIMLEHDGILQRWEDLCSGRAIMRDYHQMASEITSQRIWQEIAHKMALGFLAFLPVLQPEMVIIGGGIGTHFERYKDPLVAKLKASLPAMVPLPPIRKAVHPEEAVIYGCYHLAKQYLAAK